MLRMIPFLSLAMVATWLVGCGGESHLSIEQERIALAKEASTVMSSAKTFHEMLDKAPQLNSIADRLEKLAERRGKLGTPSPSEQAEIDKLRQDEAARWKTVAEENIKKFDPASLLAGGLPDMTKLQAFQSAASRVMKANVAFGVSAPVGMPAAPSLPSAEGGLPALPALPSGISIPGSPGGK